MASSFPSWLLLTVRKALSSFSPFLLSFTPIFSSSLLERISVEVDGWNSGDKLLDKKNLKTVLWIDEITGIICPTPIAKGLVQHYMIPTSKETVVILM